MNNFHVYTRQQIASTNMAPIAEFYADNLVNQHREAALFFEEFKKLDRKSVQTIVDIGCADGSLTSRIQASFPQATVIGFDVNETAIKFANAHKYANCNFLVQDISAAKLDPELENMRGTVDLVVSNFVLHWVHVEHRSRALENIHALLKQGGRLMCTIVTYHDLRLGLKLSQKAILDQWFLPFGTETIVQEWELAFKNGKFRDMGSQRMLMDHWFQGKGDYIQYASHLFAVVGSYFLRELLLEEETAKEALMFAREPFLRAFATPVGALPWAGDLSAVKRMYSPYIFATMEKAGIA